MFRSLCTAEGLLGITSANSHFFFYYTKNAFQKKNKLSKLRHRNWQYAMPNLPVWCVNLLVELCHALLRDLDFTQNVVFHSTFVWLLFFLYYFFLKNRIDVVLITSENSSLQFYFFHLFRQRIACRENLHETQGIKSYQDFYHRKYVIDTPILCCDGLLSDLFICHCRGTKEATGCQI